MRKIINYVVENFGFDNLSDFTKSIIHTKFLAITIPLAGISSIIESIFGLQSVTIFAFTLLVTLELITGITASKVKRRKIVSRRFGRFGLKVFVWLSLIFILNTLRLEYLLHEDFFGAIAYGLFTWLHGTLFIYVCLEYLISVIENLGDISGKSTKGITKKIREKFKGFINDEKNK